MNINEAFPSKYLKAADIPEEGRTCVISRVDEEEVGRDKEVRPILYFEGVEKGVVLNKTNATNISKLYGAETDDWVGKKVMIGTAWVDFNGQSTEGIRIYPPKRSSPNAPLGKQAEKREPADASVGDREFAPRGGDLDDDIPFSPEFR